jgi:hypothetical protein
MKNAIIKMSNDWILETAMNNGGIRRVVFGAILLAAAAGLWAADHYTVINGPKDFYYGHISYIEPTPDGTDPVVLREGRQDPEQAVVNLPVGPGDTVRTSADKRCEIQFDTGTIVRLDFATEVRVETILARSLSRLDELSVLTLDKGRIYVMYREYNHKEIFQVLTPNAAVKMKHDSVVLVAAAADGTTETQVRYGRAQVLFGPAEGSLSDRPVGKGERLIVLKDHQSELAAAIEDTAFELWNKDINAHFDDFHEGVNALPKPVQKMTPAVFYFAQTYGSRYGEWIWDDVYGYVWRPYIDNGAYPWGWSPYYYGRWSYARGQMFWVPQEPWGWIPYHLGVWQWDKKHGWVWLPGSMFAPAWATWDFYFGYACWRPWGLFDWMFDYDPSWGSGFGYFNGVWAYEPYGKVGPWTPYGSPRTGVSGEHMIRAEGTTYPVPAELKGVVKKATAALESGDDRIRASAAATPRHLVFVAKDDLGARAISEKALTWDQVPKSGAPLARADAARRRPADPESEAARIFRGIDGEAMAPRAVSAPERKAVEGRDPAAVPVNPGRRVEKPIRSEGIPAARFRDWNPDLRIARDLGVHIEYSSVRNEIRCPELKFSSQDRQRITGLTPHLTSEGISYGPAISVDGDYAGGSGLSGPPGSSAPSGPASAKDPSSRTSASPSSKSGESKSSGGGKIKN